MPRHEESRIVSYSAERMYELVADVGCYPEFLPWCIAARVREQTAKHILADLVIGWKLIRESFTSRVELHPKTRIDVEYINGPFKYLKNTWYFEEAGKNKCNIHFMVDFEFRSTLLAGLMEPVFSPAVQRMIAAFEKRAKQLYG